LPNPFYTPSSAQTSAVRDPRKLTVRLSYDLKPDGGSDLRSRYVKRTAVDVLSTEDGARLHVVGFRLSKHVIKLQDESISKKNEEKRDSIR